MEDELPDDGLLLELLSPSELELELFCPSVELDDDELWEDALLNSLWLLVSLCSVELLDIEESDVSELLSLVELCEDV